MSTVAMPAVPLYQQGLSAPHYVRKFAHLAAAPRIPLHQLGWLGAGAQQATDIAASAGGKIASSALVAAGAPFWAVPAVGAIVAGITIFASLWAKHELRAKQAKNENQAVDTAVANWDESLRAINQAYNSGQIDGNTALQAVQQTMTNYWAQVSPMIQPGRNGCQSGSAPLAYGTHYCQGSYGAACCVGYTDLMQSIFGADGNPPQGRKMIPGILDAISTAETSGSATSQVYPVFPSKYGGTSRGGYTLTWKKPPPGSGLSSIASALTGGSGGSILPLALAAVAAFLIFK